MHPFTSACDDSAIIASNEHRSDGMLESLKDVLTDIEPSNPPLQVAIFPDAHHPEAVRALTRLLTESGVDVIPMDDSIEGDTSDSRRIAVLGGAMPMMDAAVLRARVRESEHVNPVSQRTPTYPQGRKKMSKHDRRRHRG